MNHFANAVKLLVLSFPLALPAAASMMLAASRKRRIVLRTAPVGTPPLRGIGSSRRNSVGTALLFGLILSPSLPAVAALRGAYVEAILPSKPFKFAVIARQNLFADVLVAGDGAFGVTSITATNIDNFAKTLAVSEPGQFVGHDCGAPVSTVFSDLVVAVPALSTVHLTFPSPLVFNAVNGHTCFRLYIYENSRMNVLLNGFSN